MAYSPVNMRNVSLIFLLVLIVITVGVLLVGQRLDARWAGGSGGIEPCQATLVYGDTVVGRGQIMSTSADDYAEYELCDGTHLYLDQNTQLRLSYYRNPAAQTETQLELIQGRVIVDGLASIKARNLIAQVKGSACEFVHYSWRDELDVTPLATDACKIKTPAFTPTASLTSRFNTFDGSLISTNSFDPSTSAAKSFYEWTGLRP